MSDAIGHRSFSTEDAKRVIPRRDSGSHKWGVGGLMIVAGSPGYIGAPALAAMAAQRVGAGIVNLVVPRGLISPIATLVPEAAFVPISDGDLGSNGTKLMDTIGERAERCRAFLVGPGLGDDRYAQDLVRALLGLTQPHAKVSFGFGVSTASSEAVQGERRSLLSFEHPIVVDADALNILATISDWWTGIPENRLVLTPHVGEMSRLLDATSEDVLSAPDAAAVEASRRFRQVVVLKGDPTLIAAGTTVYASASTPTSLATAGTGDVLAGAIGGFVAQGVGLVEAANLAVLIGCRAAETLQAELGELGLVASDLPRAMAIELVRIANA